MQMMAKICEDGIHWSSGGTLRRGRVCQWVTWCVSGVWGMCLWLMGMEAADMMKVALVAMGLALGPWRWHG